MNARVCSVAVAAVASLGTWLYSELRAQKARCMLRTPAACQMAYPNNPWRSVKLRNVTWVRKWDRAIRAADYTRHDSTKNAQCAKYVAVPGALATRNALLTIKDTSRIEPPHGGFFFFFEGTEKTRLPGEKMRVGSYIRVYK